MLGLWLFFCARKKKDRRERFRMIRIDPCGLFSFYFMIGKKRLILYDLPALDQIHDRGYKGKKDAEEGKPPSPSDACASSGMSKGSENEVQYTECGNIKSRIRQGVERSLCVADRREVDLKEQECKACKKE